jgi:hypothetical protein
LQLLAKEENMLGDKIGELRGRVIGQRILPPDGSLPRTETSFEISGTVLGVEVTAMGTYLSTFRPDGTVYGECPWQGIMMTKDGEVGTWSAAGVHRPKKPGGAASLRGAVYYQIASSKLARLNEIAVPYEWEIDANGNAECRLWEWK